ncbi:MAG: phytoene desaturase [Bacteroidia bacterium]|nr:phytoene desaturase [Bacteroidia bacterium]
MNKKVIIIGSGFSSLAASCYLAQAGYDVHMFEKNVQLGGRARQLKRDGFTFDIGPTFYWMPDVFEAFFNDFGKKVSDFYTLNRLNPGYQVYFGANDSLSLPDNLDDIKSIFESIEKGSSDKLEQFISNAKKNYELAIQDLVYQPGENLMEIINLKTVGKLDLFIKTIKGQVAAYFQNPRLKKIMEFPVLFLGAKPSTTPAFYNFMNYADFALGTWHPKGGMYEVVEAMVKLAKDLGVHIQTDTEVQEIQTNNKKVKAIRTSKGEFECDILLSGADYAHTESLLKEGARQYSEKYWSKRTFAPSALLFFIGFNKKLKNVAHHTLFFEAEFEKHAEAIYDQPEWPEDPLFYGSFSSITDAKMAPEGKEAATILIPIAPNLEDTDEIRKKYFDLIIAHLERLTDQDLKQDIIFYESYCVRDFISDYNSYKGNAYGLANTLLQTHILRPKLKSKKIENMYFTGQLTVPGPGVPPSIISGKIVSQLIKKYE